MAARLVTAPSSLRSLSENGCFLERVGTDCDPLHFVTGRDYLRRGLTVSERVGYYLVHQEYVGDRRLPDDGLELWRSGDVDLRLERTSALERREGELSVVLRVGGRPHAVVSYVYTGHGVLVGRSQVHPGEVLTAFEGAFPHESARMFCLAALGGIVAANGLSDVLAVDGLSQVCWERPLEQTFRRSYDEVWVSLGGMPMGEGLYRLPSSVVAPVDAPVSARNRSRARRRRARWADIHSMTVTALDRAGHLTGR